MKWGFDMTIRNEIRFLAVSSQPDRFAAELQGWMQGFRMECVRFFDPRQFLATPLSPWDVLIVDFPATGEGGGDGLGYTLPAGWPLLRVLPAGAEGVDGHASLPCTEIFVRPGVQGEFSVRLKRLCRLLGVDTRLAKLLTLKLNLIGESEALREVVGNLVKYARCEAPVLLTGETGTGKELIARAIHYLDVRDDKPFVPVNCGTLPDSLVENELFGHARGAFTDGAEEHRGLVEQADGGTLFLDEIEALSPKGQVALLRFLPDYEYRPLGSRQRIKRAKLRLITASNESLERLMDAGVFRRDLFYRLNILPLHLPPLRERQGDVPILAEHFLEKYRRTYQLSDRYLDPRSLEWMVRYHWPGNVRELENLILRWFLLADSNRITIPPPQGTGSGRQGERRQSTVDRRHRQLYQGEFHTAKAEIVRQFEQTYLQQALHRAGGNISEAARQSGKERRTFAKLLLKHGLSRELSLQNR